MDERDWLLLQALRDTRNITKAATLLNTTQPGLSRRLQMLEERFGVSIALRNKSGMEFTPEGEHLITYADRMLEALRTVQERLSDMSSEVTGTLRISASNYSISHILPKGLAAFKKIHPHVEFQVSSAWSSEVIKAVGSGEAHIGFMRSERPTLPDPFLLLCEKNYICSARELDLANLPDEPQIAYRSDSLVSARLQHWWAETCKRPPRVTMVVDRMASAMEMVRHGLGYGFFPEKMAERMTEVHHYEMRHADGKPYMSRTWIITNEDARKLRVVASFLEFMATWPLVSLGVPDHS